ncbi:MAG: hypothetical protein G01um101429_998, partial [Parcubacteria group bacterium Gr01-1014_29]
ANTGGGGGGNGDGGVTGASGSGGSGVVIVRFTTVTVSQTANTLLRVTDSSSNASTTLALFENGLGQLCIIQGQTASLACSSDESLKKNVVTMDDTLTKVLSLNPVLFDWKQGPDDETALDENGNPVKRGEYVGLIAQDVAKLFDGYHGLVITDPNGKLALAYDRMVPILVKSMQEYFGGLQGLEVSAINVSDMFSSTTTLDKLASADAGTDFIANPITWIREKVEAGINIARSLVAERVVAVSGYFKRIFANELCLTDSSGSLVCVTGDALKNLNGAQTKTIQSEENQQTPVIDSTQNQFLQNSDDTGQVSSSQVEENQPATIPLDSQESLTGQAETSDAGEQIANVEPDPLPEDSTLAPGAVGEPAGEVVEQTEQTQAENVVEEPAEPVIEPEPAPDQVSNQESVPEPVTDSTPNQSADATWQASSPQAEQPVAQPESTTSN